MSIKERLEIMKAYQSAFIKYKENNNNINIDSLRNKSAYINLSIAEQIRKM